MDPKYLPKTFDGKLIHITEECAEVIKCVTKMQRFGVNGFHPRRKTTATNRDNLLWEMKDLKVACNRIEKELKKIPRE